MKKVKLLLYVVVGVTLASCNWGPSSLDETQDQILTAAYKSDSANFSAFQTYAITDSLSVVNNKQKYRVSNDTTALIIAQVAKNLESIGYMQVDADDSPNLLVDISYILKTNTSVYPGYWNDWDSWWDYNYYPWDYWDPYYPYHMPATISSYTTGSLIIEIVDVVNIANETSVPVVWHGLIRSILNGTHTQAELLSSITEVFTILPPSN